MKNLEATGRYLALTAGALISLAVFLATPGAFAETVDRIVAVINDSVITQSELNAAAASAAERLGPEARKDAKKMADLKAGVLDSIIEQKLVKQAADKAGIEVSEREIDNAVEEVKRLNSMAHEGFLLALAQNGLTYRQYREQVKEQIRQVKFIDKEFRSRITVPDEEIQDYYRQNMDEFTGKPSFRIRLIFLSGGNIKRQSAKLGAVRNGLAAGVLFDALAREYSDSPAAASGGDLGFVRPGEIDKELEEAALKLKPGEVSAPIFKADGIYVIKLEESKRGASEPLAQVRSQIHEKIFKKIMDARFAFWLKEVKKYAHVAVRL